jgi:transcriptional regulator GlxA family with amidase domain
MSAVYVTKQRIRRAQALMLGSRVSLSQIARDYGMSDQPHFFARTSVSVWVGGDSSVRTI